MAPIREPLVSKRMAPAMPKWRTALPRVEGDAITFVYSINLIPLSLAVLFMFMLVRKGEPPDRAG